eukprot:GHVH01003821.1.p1 GENE.GHVH01003821.1~~GHVH01003821.1.p1  ORF type:complete len:323 (+),score=39.11 GHVH01003821.1:234-1202(+)
MSTVPYQLEHLVNDVKVGSASAYSPYSETKQCCVFEYKQGGVYRKIRGIVLENCATPNSLSAIHSAIVDLRSSHGHDEEIVLTNIVTSHMPNSRDLSLLHQVADFTKVVLHVADEYQYPSDDDRKSIVFRTMPNMKLAKPLQYPADGVTPEMYAGFRYQGEAPLTTQEVQLIKAAFEGMRCAYPANSRFCVGASFQVLLNDGTVETVCGGNIEATELSDTLCAERTALCKIANRYLPAKSGTKIIRGSCALFGDVTASPCGSCRQNLAEWGRFEMLLVKCNVEEKSFVVERWLTTGDGSLLPMPFTPESLGVQGTPLSWSRI